MVRVGIIAFRSAYFVTCTSVVKDAEGRIVELRCTYDPATRGGDAPDGRRLKATLHWVSAAHAIPAEVRLYDHLFSRPDPGADGDLFEGGKILGRRFELLQMMRPEVHNIPWFTTDITLDPDFPSGQYVRTAVATDADGEGCVFLHHDKRGCAIHRASIENNWDFRGTKPHICRLFPLSYDEEGIVISDDYEDYSCAFVDTAPTLYRHTRALFAELFGEELVQVLDEAEAKALKLRVV